MADEYYTIDEVAEMLHMHKSSVYRLITDGLIGSYKPPRGKARLIGRKHLDTFMKACEVEV